MGRVCGLTPKSDRQFPYSDRKANALGQNGISPLQLQLIPYLLQ